MRAARLCLGVLLVAGSAEAQVCPSPALAPGGQTSARSTPSPAPTPACARARAEFERGVHLFREGELADAAVAFARAYELSSDYRLLYNMAQLEAEQDHPAAALRLLSRYLRGGGAHVNAARREEVARERARLEQRAAALRVTSSADDAVLWLDGERVGRLPSEVLWLDPGEHRLVVEAEGRGLAGQSVTLLPGARRLLAVSLPEPAPVRAPLVALEPAPERDRTPLWISVGAAGAAGVLAATFSILTRAADAKLERELARYPANEADLGAARSRVRTLSTASDASLGVAAIASGLSLYFVLRKVSTTSPAATESVSVRVTPLGLGASLRGRF